MTTGCTIEAHNFQRDLPKYDALNAVVLGVSLDTVESHKTFCTKDSLTFKLLADPDHKVIDAYGVPLAAHGDNKFAQRDTFLISPSGKMVKAGTEGSIRTPTATTSSPTIAARKEINRHTITSRRKKARALNEESGPFCLPLMVRLLLLRSLLRGLLRSLLCWPS